MFHRSRLSLPVLLQLLLLFQLLVTAGLANATPVAFTTREAAFAIDDQGSLERITRLTDGRNFLAPGQPAPLLAVRVDGRMHAPTDRSWNASLSRLTLRYPAIETTVELTVAVKDTHLTFETAAVTSPRRIELIVWGPYPTIIGETIGEVIGVVRDAEFAIGIQSLNLKTLGGYPNHEHDIEPDDVADDTGRYDDLPEELKKDQLFRGDTARRTGFGSVLQAYCRNRDQERVIANWGHERYVAPAFADGGIVGSRIALFAVSEPRALETIGAIERAEGLPHPMLDGVWAKQSPKANASYLIVDFSEATLEQAVEMTRKAGLEWLYHSSPFETWGHFRLKPELFPRGWDGLKDGVDRARALGVRLGFHTLSNFITPNDPYVTPVPDPRLARIGTTSLPSAITTDQVEIPLADPDFFRQETALNTVRIGTELIRYRAVSDTAPWRLLECQRGAWGTRPSAHANGVPVAKLMDHGYNVFLTDADLTQEVARRLADLCNHTGTLQISLDGLEGAWSTGMGQYGRTLFAQSWYQHLRPEFRGQINDASNPGHFNWHSYTRMNWGEPWYAGFRESQTLYRFKNQLHFARNLMPRMLGWFALRADTSLEDAQWLLARSAGFDAGFALAASLASTAQLQADPTAAETARAYGAVPSILEAIRHWETARLADAFPPAVRAALRDNAREFHLQPVGDRQWDLFEVHLERLTLDATTNNTAVLRFRRAPEWQPLQWILRSTSPQKVTGLTLTLNGRPMLDLNGVTLPPNGSLAYRGGAEAIVSDAAWKEIARVPVHREVVSEVGATQVTLGCQPQADTRLNLELRNLGAPTRLAAGR
jgi:hypothetical protein